MRKLAATLLLISAPFVAGCFDIEQSLSIERNLSGRAGFAMKVDMEPMVAFMAQIKKSMSGDKGAPTAAEIAEARKEMVSETGKSDPAEFEREKAEFQKTLPRGVTLLEATAKEGDLKMAVNMLFGFDHVSKLAQIKFPKKSNDPGENPVDAPFDGLIVTDEGATILVTSKAQNPMADAKSEMPPTGDPGMEKQIMDLFKGLRVAFKITSPFTVVEQNAHRREGNTLIWEFDVTSLSKMKPEQLAQPIRVRFRK